MNRETQEGIEMRQQDRVRPVLRPGVYAYCRNNRGHGSSNLRVVAVKPGTPRRAQIRFYTPGEIVEILVTSHWLGRMSAPKTVGQFVNKYAW